jgi:hypothetical protein
MPITDRSILDAASGDLLGLVDVEIWNRRQRVTKKARSVNVVMDREGDDYHDFAHRP